MEYDVSKLELKENDIVLITLKTDKYGGLIIPQDEVLALYKSIQTLVQPNRIVAIPDMLNIESLSVREIEHIRDCLNILLDGCK